MTETTPTSTKSRDPHYFTIAGKTYAVQLVKSNYDTLNAIIGFSTAQPAKDVEVQEITMSKAIQEGYLFPLLIEGQAGKKKKRAKIVVVRSKIEDAFASSSGVRGKQYGTWVIGEVRPIMKRLITV